MRLFRVQRMTDAEAAKWAEIRDRGRRRYILMTGVLGWGIYMAIGVTVVKQLLFEEPGPFLGRLAIALVLFPLGGTWFAQRMWTDNERRYVEWISSTRPTAS